MPGLAFNSIVLYGRHRGNLRREFTGDSLDHRIARYGDLASPKRQWSGQLWLGTQAPNETGRCEAGTDPRHKKPRFGERRGKLNSTWRSSSGRSVCFIITASAGALRERGSCRALLFGRGSSGGRGRHAAKLRLTGILFPIGFVAVVRAGSSDRPVPFDRRSPSPRPLARHLGIHGLKAGAGKSLEKSEKRAVQPARNALSEDRKCWQRVELGIHGLNR